MGMGEISVKALRNLTSQQILALDADDPTYVTHRGTRIAEIRPIGATSALDTLLDRVYSRANSDTGALDELLASRAASIAVQASTDT